MATNTLKSMSTVSTIYHCLDLSPSSSSTPTNIELIEANVHEHKNRKHEREREGGREMGIEFWYDERSDVVSFELHAGGGFFQYDSDSEDDDDVDGENGSTNGTRKAQRPTSLSPTQQQETIAITVKEKDKHTSSSSLLTKASKIKPNSHRHYTFIHNRNKLKTPTSDDKDKKVEESGYWYNEKSKHKHNEKPNDLIDYERKQRKLASNKIAQLLKKYSTMIELDNAAYIQKRHKNEVLLMDGINTRVQEEQSIKLGSGSGYLKGMIKSALARTERGRRVCLLLAVKSFKRYKDIKSESTNTSSSCSSNVKSDKIKHLEKCKAHLIKAYTLTPSFPSLQLKVLTGLASVNVMLYDEGVDFHSLFNPSVDANAKANTSASKGGYVGYQKMRRMKYELLDEALKYLDIALQACSDSEIRESAVCNTIADANDNKITQLQIHLLKAKIHLKLQSYSSGLSCLNILLQPCNSEVIMRCSSSITNGLMLATITSAIQTLLKIGGKQELEQCIVLLTFFLRNCDKMIRDFASASFSISDDDDDNHHDHDHGIPTFNPFYLNLNLNEPNEVYSTNEPHPPPNQSMHGHVDEVITRTKIAFTLLLSTILVKLNRRGEALVGNIDAFRFHSSLSSSNNDEVNNSNNRNSDEINSIKFFNSPSTFLEYSMFIVSTYGCDCYILANYLVGLGVLHLEMGFDTSGDGANSSGMSTNTNTTTTHEYEYEYVMKRAHSTLQYITEPTPTSAIFTVIKLQLLEVSPNPGGCCKYGYWDIRLRFILAQWCSGFKCEFECEERAVNVVISFARLVIAINVRNLIIRERDAALRIEMKHEEWIADFRNRNDDRKMKRSCARWRAYLKHIRGVKSTSATVIERRVKTRRAVKTLKRTLARIEDNEVRILINVKKLNLKVFKVCFIKWLRKRDIGVRVKLEKRLFNYAKLVVRKRRLRLTNIINIFLNNHDSMLLLRCVNSWRAFLRHGQMFRRVVRIQSVVRKGASKLYTEKLRVFTHNCENAIIRNVRKKEFKRTRYAFFRIRKRFRYYRKKHAIYVINYAIRIHLAKQKLKSKRSKLELVLRMVKWVEDANVERICRGFVRVLVRGRRDRKAMNIQSVVRRKSSLTTLSVLRAVNQDALNFNVYRFKKYFISQVVYVHFIRFIELCRIDRIELVVRLQCFLRGVIARCVCKGLKDAERGVESVVSAFIAQGRMMNKANCFLALRWLITMKRSAVTIQCFARTMTALPIYRRLNQRRLRVDGIIRVCAARRRNRTKQRAFRTLVRYLRTCRSSRVVIGAFRSYKSRVNATRLSEIKADKTSSVRLMCKTRNVIVVKSAFSVWKRYRDLLVLHNAGVIVRSFVSTKIREKLNKRTNDLVRIQIQTILSTVDDITVNRYEAAFRINLVFRRFLSIKLTNILKNLKRRHEKLFVGLNEKRRSRSLRACLSSWSVHVERSRKALVVIQKYTRKLLASLSFAIMKSRRAELVLTLDERRKVRRVSMLRECFGVWWGGVLEVFLHDFENNSFSEEEEEEKDDSESPVAVPQRRHSLPSILSPTQQQQRQQQQQQQRRYSLPTLEQSSPPNNNKCNIKYLPPLRPWHSKDAQSQAYFNSKSQVKRTGVLILNYDTRNERDELTYIDKMALSSAATVLIVNGVNGQGDFAEICAILRHCIGVEKIVISGSGSFDRNINVEELVKVICNADSSVISVSVADVNIGQAGAVCLAKGLSDLKRAQTNAFKSQLKNLTLQNCNIDQQGLLVLLYVLSLHSPVQLNTINLSRNLIGDTTVMQKVVRNFVNAQVELDVIDVGQCDAGVVLFEGLIGGLGDGEGDERRVVSVLRLNFNPGLSDGCVNVLAKALEGDSTKTKLTIDDLRLTNCNITSKGFRRLSDCLMLRSALKTRKNVSFNLNRLDLSCNRVSERECYGLSNFIDSSRSGGGGGGGMEVVFESIPGAR